MEKYVHVLIGVTHWHIVYRIKYVWAGLQVTTYGYILRTEYISIDWREEGVLAFQTLLFTN